jgi:hypothetical protein
MVKAEEGRWLEPVHHPMFLPNWFFGRPTAYEDDIQQQPGYLLVTVNVQDVFAHLPVHEHWTN